MFHLAEILADQPRNDVCQDTGREEFGWALIGHDYKSSTAESFGRCFFDCSLDEKLPRYFYSTLFKGKQIDCISLNGLDKVYCGALIANFYQFNYLCLCYQNVPFYC